MALLGQLVVQLIIPVLRLGFLIGYGNEHVICTISVIHNVAAQVNGNAT